MTSVNYRLDLRIRPVEISMMFSRKAMTGLVKSVRRAGSVAIASFNIVVRHLTESRSAIIKNLVTTVQKIRSPDQTITFLWVELLFSSSAVLMSS
jgi:flagellar biosynthesis protein FlhB